LKLGRIVGVFADIHGSTRTLGRALERCAAEGVETIALLGDLFDRPEQADGCVATLTGWEVVGVYGNHEKEVALEAAAGGIDLLAETIAFLSQLQEDLIIDEVHFTHEVHLWGHDDPIARLFGRGRSGNHDAHQPQARLTFTGHTHFRQARDERGALDIARGALPLDDARRYLINPGALLIGQYAIWNRDEGIVYFRNVEH
jgi:predicted phosphodiesterase